MLFGLTNVLIIYQALINNILKEYLNDFIVTYLNNIFIYSKTKTKYKEYINKVLKKLKYILKQIYLVNNKTTLKKKKRQE